MSAKNLDNILLLKYMVYPASGYRVRVRVFIYIHRVSCKDTFALIIGKDVS